LSDQIGSRPDSDLASFAARFAQLEQTLAAVVRRLDCLEKSVATLGEYVGESRDRAEAGIRQIEHQLDQHAATLASSRTAVAQTDDLVERVVEALESLQSSVLQPEARALGVN